MESKNGKNSLFGALTPEKSAGFVYSAAAILPVLLSFVFLIFVQASGMTAAEYTKKDWYLYCSFLLPQIGYAIVAVVFFRKSKTPVKAVAGKCAPKYFLLAVVLQIGLFSLARLNNLFIDFLRRFGYEDGGIVLPSMDGAGFFGVLLVVALLPAVFEETIFRGIVLGGLKGFGKVGAILVCGALFSLYHQNPAQTVYQFVCGAAFALVALRAGSILPTVLSHLLNNAVILLLEKFGVSAFSQTTTIIVMVVSALCLVCSAAYLIFWDKKGGAAEEATENAAQKRKNFLLYAAAGILICAVMWVSVLISGIGR